MTMKVELAAKITWIALATMTVCSASLFGQNLTWKLTDAPQNGEWSSVASSADGTRLAAVCPNLGICVSTNSGAHWMQTITGRYWDCLASSADGMTVLAGSEAAGIYISTNSGLTWTPTGATNAYWDAIASSSNGANLVAESLARGWVLLQRDGTSTQAERRPA